MNAALFAYSRQGCATLRRLRAALPGTTVRTFAPARLALPPLEIIPQPSQSFYGDQFAWADALLFVGSCGLAVRLIAPHVQDKATDPAVVVVDEQAAFVIPLLSGHLGGANDLAQQLADQLSATAVITTATDRRGRFAADAWAARKGYPWADRQTAKAVSAAILEGDVPLCSDLPVTGPYPPGLVPGQEGPVGIYIGYRTLRPFAQTMAVFPPVLHLGIGCRKGVSQARIAQVVTEALDRHGLDRRAVKLVASLDRKAEEPGLVAFAQHNGWPLRCYAPDQLRQVHGAVSPSPFVAEVTGVDNVCERAALVGADRLLVPKYARDGVTVAVAAEKGAVSFV